MIRGFSCKILGHIYFEVGEEFSHLETTTQKNMVTHQLEAVEVPYYNRILKCSKCGKVIKKPFNRFLDEETRRKPSEAERKAHALSGRF